MHKVLQEYYTMPLLVVLLLLFKNNESLLLYKDIKIEIDFLIIRCFPYNTT